MSSVQGVCNCPRDALCDDCMRRNLSHLSGVAATRGGYWAASVARVRPDLWPHPWPAHEGRAAAIAERHVADLTGDPRLRAEFARIASTGAARWWATECCAGAGRGDGRHDRGCRRAQRKLGCALPSRFG